MRHSVCRARSVSAAPESVSKAVAGRVNRDARRGSVASRRRRVDSQQAPQEAPHCLPCPAEPCPAAPLQWNVLFASDEKMAGECPAPDKKSRKQPACGEGCWGWGLAGHLFQVGGLRVAVESDGRPREVTGRRLASVPGRLKRVYLISRSFISSPPAWPANQRACTAFIPVEFHLDVAINFPFESVRRRSAPGGTPSRAPEEGNR